MTYILKSTLTLGLFIVCLSTNLYGSTVATAKESDLDLPVYGDVPKGFLTFHLPNAKDFFTFARKERAKKATRDHPAQAAYINGKTCTEKHNGYTVTIFKGQSQHKVHTGETHSHKVNKIDGLRFTFTLYDQSWPETLFLEKFVPGLASKDIYAHGGWQTVKAVGTNGKPTFWLTVSYVNSLYPLLFIRNKNE